MEHFYAADLNFNPSIKETERSKSHVANMTVFRKKHDISPILATCTCLIFCKRS